MATKVRSPTQAPCESAEGLRPEARLATCAGLIRDAARHCGDYDRRGLDFEDIVQEATIEVWCALKNYPTAPIGYIWLVARRAALDALQKGHSVDWLRTDRQFNYQVVSLEALLLGKDGENLLVEALARRKRRGEVPNPTEEAAIAHIMLQELEERLTPRQHQVLELRLRQFSESQIAAVLGVSQHSVSRLVTAIRAKAKAAWGDKPQPPRVKLTPEEAKERLRERWRRKQRRRYAQHRVEYNARRRASLNAIRAQWRDQGRCSRCGGAPVPGHKMCPKCQMRQRQSNGKGESPCPCASGH